MAVASHTESAAPIGHHPVRTAIPRADERQPLHREVISIAARIFVDLLLRGVLAIVGVFDWLRGRRATHSSSRAAESGVAPGTRSNELAFGGNPRHLLIAGTFYNVGWYRSHILPLSACTALDRIIVVSEEPLFPVDKVVYCCPPRWAQRVFGRAALRLIWSFFMAWRHRCGVLMGYHLMPNALLCLTVARMLNRRAIYQMTGGPTQIKGGGYAGENSLLRLLRKPSAKREALMFSVVRKMDDVIVRGNDARAFLESNQLSRSTTFVPGSIDIERFSPTNSEPEFDLVAVGRLVPVKRVDRMLRIMVELVRVRPRTRLDLVGDGFLRPDLEKLTDALGLRDAVRFSGKQLDVAPFLKNARALLLTSEIEGLSIAMIEASACGLPCFAPRIGDLDMILRDDLDTGVFIDPDQPRVAAESIAECLNDAQRLREMSAAARRHASEMCSVAAVATTWNRLLTPANRNTDRAQ